MSEPVTVERRFLGPPDLVNGGYACGLLGTRLGSCAGISLRRPIPIGKRLAIQLGEAEAQLLDGKTLLADGGAAELELEVPEPPSFDQAREAEANYIFHNDHPFPECFVCGPARESGDGLRIFPGKVGERDIVASGWIPDRSLPSSGGAIDDLIVWSALDCPTAFGAWMGGVGGVSVLAKLEGRLLDRVEIGIEHVALGWPIGADGRKQWGGSAIFRADGALCAYGRGLWIELRKPEGD